MLRISIFIYLFFSSSSVIVFFLPLYFQNTQGLNADQIGQIIASGALISVFSQAFWGYTSDRRKTVKGILIVLLSGCFIFSFGLFSANTFMMIVLFYTVFMFFNSAMPSMSDTLTISYAEQNNRDYGKIRLWGEVGIGVSAFLLGILIEKIETMEYLWLIYLIALSAAIVASLFLRDTKSTSKPINFKALGKVFSQPKLLWFLFMVLLVAIPHRMNDSMLALYLSELGGTESQLGLAWLMATMSTVPALIYVGRMIKWWNELGIFIIAALMYGTRWLIYSIAESPNVIIAFQTMHSLTFPLFLVASIQYLISIVPPELRATGQASFAVTFGGLGGIIGSSVGGQIMHTYGPTVMYSLSSFLAFVGASAAIATYIYNKRQSDKPSLTVD